MTAPELQASFASDLRASLPGLTEGQIATYVAQLKPEPTQDSYKEIMHYAQGQANTNIARVASDQAHADANIAKGDAAMNKTGINPFTQERLTLENAPNATPTVHPVKVCQLYGVW